MTAKIKLNAASGNGSVSLKAPSSTTGNAAVELQLPVADGTNGQVLKTDGSGNLSFGADTGGKILQVVQTVKTDTTSISTIDTWTDISGMSVSITPSSSSNKILVTAVLNTGASQETYYILRLEKGGTPIALGDASGGRSRGYFGQRSPNHGEFIDNSVINFLDTAGSTSAITYNVAWYIAFQSGSSLYLNRCQFDANNDYAPRMSSTITAMEVAA